MGFVYTKVCSSGSGRRGSTLQGNFGKKISEQKCRYDDLGRLISDLPNNVGDGSYIEEI